MSQKEIRSWKKVFESDLPHVVSEFKESVSRPSVILLSGEMGVGKTCFARAFAGGGEGGLKSPTYSILSENMTIAHADFYRVKDADEIVHLELASYLENKDYFLVEWGKRYLSTFIRDIEERFVNVYELNIEVKNKNDEHSSRDYYLYKLDRSNY